MKVGVLSAGAVGATCIVAVARRAAAHEVVVIYKEEGQVLGLLTDMQYSTQLCPTVCLAGGDSSNITG